MARRALAVFGLCPIIILSLFFGSATASATPDSGKVIAQYRPLLKPFYDERGRLWAAVRAFSHSGRDRLLCLDPYGFSLQEMPPEALKNGTPAQPEDWFAAPFGRALHRYTAGPFKLQNHGLIRAEHSPDGYFLTVDLCPSSKPLDRRLFLAIASLSQPWPIPVAVMVSGRWLRDHREDLQWLKGLSSTGRLAISWCNHSLTHPYDPALPLEGNFLLMPNVDFEREFLGVEQILLAEGLLPAPFFRFPGLVAGQGLVERLRKLSAIPVGSDSWLAKGESPRPGSIILVHGNGNEPLGVKKLMDFFKETAAPGNRSRTTLLPLSGAFATAP